MISTLKPALSRLRPAGGLPPGLVKSLGPIITLAVGVTLAVLMFLWRDQSGYKAVFGAREKVPAAEMMAVLDAEGVRYRVHPDSGQVLVPEAQLGKVRMLLAAKGVTAKLPSGLELMDKNDPLGVSQFVQDVRFRRGLEGELAQSIMTFDAVDSARVHLSIAKSSSFVVSDGEKSSASVMVQLKPGRTLSHEQIAAAINLVAGSVASLEPSRVSLVDQAGNLLSARIDLADAMDGTAQVSDAAKRYTEEARRNVRDLLSPVLGEDNYKTSVTAQVDNDRVQETHETYGATPKVTNEAMRQEMDRDGVAVGVPGSLSNRPVAVAASQPADAGTASKNATTRQYAYDRNITQIKRSRGRLAKLNVAVVLNASAAPSGKGSWTNEEIAGVEKMLRSGLGISNERGDTLVVSAMPFPARPAPEPWWQQRDNIVDITGYVGYAVAALLGFLLIVRPLMKLMQHRYGASSVTPLTPIPPAPQAATIDRPSALGSNPAVAALPKPGADAVLPGAAQIAATAAAMAAAGAQPGDMSVRPLLENYDLPPPGSPVDVLVDHLKVLAGKEPERVAEVVKQWVQKNERAEQPA